MAVQDLVYDLDAETAIPIRVRSYLGNLNENDLDSSPPAWTWTALSVDSIQGFHMPLRSSMISYGGAGISATDKRMAIEVKVESLSYDKSYPKETFWPVIQPGTTVLDSIKKTQYAVPGKTIGDIHFGGENETTTSVAQAVQPVHWSAWGSTASFGLGGALIFVGLISMAPSSCRLGHQIHEHSRVQRSCGRATFAS